MKFLANDSRTKHLLAQWSRTSNFLIVKYFFWLSGSRIQRSLKGLLCSLTRQIILGEEGLVEKSTYTDKILLTKRNIHDWSDGELQQFLRLLTNLMVRPICIFVDGLDEFDQRDDTDGLLNLIEELSMTDRIKVCVSSRPENHIVKRLSQYSQIRLQDLTADDMEICIRDELQRVCQNYPRASLSEHHFNKIVAVMIKKADGVFLWVYYALSSLMRGVRNEDDFNDLLDRIEELPDEMQQLYLEMWKRLNGDQQRYRDEAATYFSYMEFFPMSLFEMLVALNSPLQEIYVQTFEPQDPGDLARRCERLKTRMFSRCAGLLEVETYEGECPGRSLQDENPLIAYHETKIKLLHRTAKDFLMSTEAGQKLLAPSETTLDSRFHNVIRARIAALIQGLTEFDGYWMKSIIATIGKFRTEQENELLITVKRLGQRLSIPGSPERHIGYTRFWLVYGIEYCTDFESTAAFYGCADYIRHYIKHEKRYISSYYRGFLVLCAAQGLQRLNYSQSRNLSLISWLVLQNADIHTRHCNGASKGLVFHPASEFLFSVLSFRVLRDKQLAQQAAEAIQLFLPSLVTFKGQYPVILPRSDNWLVSQNSSRLFNVPSGSSLLVHMSFVNLWCLAMKAFEEIAVFKPRWRYVTGRFSHVLLQISLARA